MTQLRSTLLRARPALLLLLTISLAAAALVVGCKSKSKPAQLAKKLHILSSGSSSYSAEIQQVTNAPQLSTLRWPDFTDDQLVVQSFYGDRDEDLAWFKDLKPTPVATALIGLFTDAAQKGLDPEDYDASRWPDRLHRIEQIRSSRDTSDNARADLARFDVALTINAVRYISDLHLGRINPQTLNFDIDVPSRRSAFDIGNFLADKLLNATDVPAAIASIEPQNPMYQATEAALPHYLDLAKQQALTPLPTLPSLAASEKPIATGGVYPALAVLQQRLQIEGDLTTPPADAPATYTDDLVAAVKHFQQRHGLSDDGKLGQATIDALNVPMAARVHQIDDALEHWRWLPDNYIQPRVLVNLPEFQLRAYNPDHGLAFKMRVVDGEARGNHDTPSFVRLMRYVVFRPYWNLPPSIVKKEIMPHIGRSGIGYLEEHDYEAYKNDGSVVTGYTAADIAHSRYSIRQRPGPKNSLGLVKFLFPNEYDVYMHSTPELNLFGLARRDKSHGCVRLQHADQMALWVMQGDQPASLDPTSPNAWDEDRISEAMNGTNNNKTYNLKTPLPVVIAYLLANADEDGTMHFFNDIYGYDKQLDAALAKGRPFNRAPTKVNPKLTPGETL